MDIKVIKKAEIPAECAKNDKHQLYHEISKITGDQALKVNLSEGTARDKTIASIRAWARNHSVKITILKEKDFIYIKLREKIKEEGCGECGSDAQHRRDIDK